MRSGCGDLDNLTFGSESRNYINCWWIFGLFMLSWAVKTETAENTDQGPKGLLSEIKDVAISNTAVK